MAGYIGKSQGVTQVDGYNRTEADDRYVNDPDAVITVSGGNVGFGTNFPSAKLEVNGDVKSNKFAFYNEGAGANFNYTGYARFANGATESMRIDSAGRVTMPYQPYFRARVDGQVNISTIGEVLPFGVIDTNIGGNYNASTYRFTAPVSGRYVFHLMIFAPPNSLVRQYFRLNSTILQSLEWYNDTVNYVNRVDTMTLYLSANDYVDTVHWQGTTHINGAWPNPNSNFSGYLIG